MYFFLLLLIAVLTGIEPVSHHRQWWRMCHYPIRPNNFYHLKMPILKYSSHTEACISGQDKHLWYQAGATGVEPAIHKVTVCYVTTNTSPPFVYFSSESSSRTRYLVGYEPRMIIIRFTPSQYIFIVPPISVDPIYLRIWAEDPCRRKRNI